MENQEITVVTGANKGLGLETCRQLKESGMHVILTGRDEANVRKAADGLTAGGAEVSWAVLDVQDTASISRFADEVREKWNGIDVLVNNAGVSDFGRFDGQAAELTVNTNFFGPMHVTDALLPLMHGGSRIVMVSSAMGQLSCLSGDLRRRFESPGLTRDELVELMRSFLRSVSDGTSVRKGWPSSAYSVSKAGLNMLTRILAAELSPKGIIVNSVHPGWVRTDMGGLSAPLDVKAGAKSIVWAALLKDGSRSGGFFHAGKPMQW
ncbi:MAG: SDR family oxidoreductase [Deltaproteobacteria bacterium]|nr:SDR family oxidoreductase [Deltaproteobacteria bacterium]MCL5791558.1 SDR family oxidoreductase [Deltaproteobacteria bacterium]